MIHGHCRTNLDNAKRWTWPTMFVAVPRIGEMVKAQESGSCTWLKVHSVTHYMSKDYNDYGQQMDERGRFDWVPRIEVKLNK